MRGPDGCEVSVIESRHFRFAETLDQREDARIDDAQPEVGISPLHVVASAQLVVAGMLQPVGTVQEVFQEDQPRLPAEPFMAPVVDLGEDQARDNEILTGIRQQGSTAPVIGIGRIECSKQRAGIADKRHQRGGPPPVGHRSERRVGHLQHHVAR